MKEQGKFYVMSHRMGKPLGPYDFEMAQRVLAIRGNNESIWTEVMVHNWERNQIALKRSMRL